MLSFKLFFIGILHKVDKLAIICYTKTLMVEKHLLIKRVVSRYCEDLLFIQKGGINEMKKLFFFGGVVCLIIDYFVRSGLTAALGLAAILTAISGGSDGSADWRTKYRPG